MIPKISSAMKGEHFTIEGLTHYKEQHQVVSTQDEGQAVMLRAEQLIDDGQPRTLQPRGVFTNTQQCSVDVKRVA